MAGKLLRKTTIEIYDEPEGADIPFDDEGLLGAVSDDLEEVEAEAPALGSRKTATKPAARRGR